MEIKPISPAVELPLSTYVNAWLLTKSEATRVHYKHTVTALGEFLHDLRTVKCLGDIAHPHLAAFIESARIKRSLQPNSVRKLYIAIKSLFKYLLSQRIININPCVDLKVRKSTGSRNEKVLHKPDRLKVMSRLPPVPALLCKTLYQSGMRISECLSLRAGDIDVNAESSSDASVGRATVLGKGSKTRDLWFSRELMKQLVLEKKSNEYVFSSKTGKPLTRQQVHRWLNKAKFVEIDGKKVQDVKRVSAHAFRHAHAIESLKHGCPINVLKKTLGHSSILTTQIYTEAANGETSSGYLSA